MDSSRQSRDTGKSRRPRDTGKGRATADSEQRQLITEARDLQQRKRDQAAQRYDQAATSSQQATSSYRYGEQRALPAVTHQQAYGAYDSAAVSYDGPPLSMRQEAYSTFNDTHASSSYYPEQAGSSAFQPASYIGSEGTAFGQPSSAFYPHSSTTDSSYVPYTEALPATSHAQETGSMASSEPMNWEYQNVQALGPGAHLAVNDTSSSSFYPDQAGPSSYRDAPYGDSRMTTAFDAPSATSEHAGMQVGLSSSGNQLAGPHESFIEDENFNNFINATAPDGRLYNIDMRYNLRPREPDNNHYDAQNNLRPPDHFDEHDILLAKHRIPPTAYLESVAYRDKSKAYANALNAYNKDLKAAGIVKMTPREIRQKRGNESRAIAKSGLQYLEDRGLSIDTTENRQPVLSTLHSFAVEQYNRQGVHNPELQQLLQDKNTFTQEMTAYHATVQRYQQMFELYVSQRADHGVVPPLSTKSYFDGRSLSYDKKGNVRPPNHYYAGVLRPRDHFDEHEIVLPVPRMSHADHQLYLDYRKSYRNKQKPTDAQLVGHNAYRKAEVEYQDEQKAAGIIDQTRKEKRAENISAKRRNARN